MQATLPYAIVIRRLVQSACYRPSFALCLGTVRCIFSDICGTDAGVGAAPASAGLGDYTAAGAPRHPARFLSRSLLTGSVVEMLFSPSLARPKQSDLERENTSGADGFLRFARDYHRALLFTGINAFYYSGATR